MKKVKFSFDKELDMLNFWQACNGFALWENDKKPIRQKFIDKWRGKSYEESKSEIAFHFDLLYNSEFINIFQNSLEKGWREIEPKYFERLEKLTQKPIYVKKFDGLITTSGRCYANNKNNSFLVSIRRPYLHALRTCGHELLHLQVNNYYWNKMENQLGMKGAAELSEGLTTLLNPNFRDLWIAEDMGYKEHKDLREYIEIEWDKDKDFERLIHKGIEKIKD